MSQPNDVRDWLVLSLKWSGEWLVWYRTASAGYTSCLMTAGRFSKEEAVSSQLDGVTMAVPLDAVFDETGIRHTMLNRPATVKRLKSESKKKLKPVKIKQEK